MKFSVIVPVYNAEKYLERCVESVIAQTYPHWEMILIDDGSKDDSWVIIERYAKKEKRIVGVHQENGGPGKARNTGLDRVTGDYIIFLDSDDYIERDYFLLLKPKAEKADIVFIDIFQVDPEGKLIKKEAMSAYKTLSKDAFQRAMMTGKAPWGGWRKAVSSNLVKTNDIKYSALSVGEEALYSFRLFEAAQKIEFLDKKPVYMYVNHEGSQSKLTMDDPWGSTVQVLKDYLQEDVEKYRVYANTLNAFNAVATIVSIDRMTQMYQGNERKNKIASRIKEYEATYDAAFDIDRKSLAMKVRVLLPFLRSGFFAPIVICSQLRRFFKR